MITIKKDEALLVAENVTGVAYQSLITDIINILRPDEEAYVGYTLEQYVEEFDYTISRLLQDIDIFPTIAAIKAVGQLTLYYESEVDNACSKCGYEVVIDENATSSAHEAEEDGYITIVGRCPICGTITLIEKPLNE